MPVSNDAAFTYVLMTTVDLRTVGDGGDRNESFFITATRRPRTTSSYTGSTLSGTNAGLYAYIPIGSRLSPRNRVWVDGSFLSGAVGCLDTTEGMKALRTLLVDRLRSVVSHILITPPILNCNGFVPELLQQGEGDSAR